MPNKKVVQYDVVKALDLKVLVEEVGQKMMRGWQPLGPMISTASFGVWQYTQTIVKYAPTESH
jgi:hypothetical protein